MSAFVTGWPRFAFCNVPVQVFINLGTRLDDHSVFALVNLGIEFRFFFRHACLLVFRSFSVLLSINLSIQCKERVPCGC